MRVFGGYISKNCFTWLTYIGYIHWIYGTNDIAEASVRFRLMWSCFHIQEKTFPPAPYLLFNIRLMTSLFNTVYCRIVGRLVKTWKVLAMTYFEAPSRHLPGKRNLSHYSRLLSGIWTQDSRTQSRTGTDSTVMSGSFVRSYKEPLLVPVRSVSVKGRVHWSLTRPGSYIQTTILVFLL
jgi:hypothetical protein